MMKKTPIHALLFALFPLFSLYDHNKQILELFYLVKPLVLTILCSIAVLASSYVLFRNLIKAGLFTSTIALLFFSFGHVLKYAFTPVLALPQLFTLFDKFCYIFLFLELIIVIFIFRILWITRKELININQLLNIISLILVGYLLINIAVYEVVTTKNKSSEVVINRDNIEKPDIYYIILDGYAREDVLKDLYAFDNSEFTHKLKEKGFYIAQNSTTNYPHTYLSLASSLNLSYLDGDQFLGNSQKEISPREMIKNNKLMSTLKNQGYTIVSTPTPWTGIQGNIKSDVPFVGNFLNDYERTLVTLTPLQLYINDEFLMNDHKQAVLSGLKALVTIPNIKRPTLTLTHVYSPHPPFIFDEDGKTNKSTKYFSRLDGNFLFEDYPQFMTIDKYREDYVSQLLFVNKKIISIVDHIITTSSVSPIIIIQSDHGPGSQFFSGNPDKTNMNERMSILNAYYLPEKGKEMLYESITPVNSFRVVFNVLFDSNLELLEDRSYFARWSQPYDFIDVTEKIKK